MSKSQLNRTVAEIKKSKRENFRVSLRERYGDVGCELRVVKADAHGEMVEGPKGCRIPLSRLDAVIAGLTDARDAARRLGFPAGGAAAPGED